MNLYSQLQTYQILTNDDEMLILYLSYSMTTATSILGFIAETCLNLLRANSSGAEGDLSAFPMPTPDRLEL